MRRTTKKDSTTLTFFSIWEEVKTGVEGERKLVERRQKLVSELTTEEFGKAVGSISRPVPPERVRDWCRMGLLVHNVDWRRAGPRIIYISVEAVPRMRNYMLKDED